MNSKLAILLGLVLASGTALAAGDQTGAMSEEGQQQHPSFSEVDTDANGLVSQEEAEQSGAQQIADNFDQADANADGYINQSEYDSLLGEQTLQE